MRHQLTRLAGLTLCAFAPAVTLAQTPPAPDAGALLKQIEQDKARNLKSTEQPSAKEATKEPAESGVEVRVERFEVKGFQKLDEAQIQSVLAPYTQRTLRYAQLREAAQAIEKAYREAGWLARADLPPQDVTDGVVRIQMVEAVYGGVRLEGSAPARVPGETILNYFRDQQALGQAFNLHAMERSLLLADDLHGVNITGALAPGQKTGQSELVLRARDEQAFGGEVEIENNGSRSTGEWQFSANAHLNSPLGFGELLRGDLLHSAGMDFVRVSGQMPLGGQGWRIGARASYLDYSLVAREYAALNASGDSMAFGAELSYPLIRSRQRDLYATLEAEVKTFTNEANAAVQSDYKVSTLGLGVQGIQHDEWGGGGLTQLSLMAVHGKVNLGSLQPGETAALDGNFNKLKYGLARHQTITPYWSGLAALSGQYGRGTLDSSERFYLGGAHGVRAYPTNEGGGDSGQLLNLELRFRWPGTHWGFSGFYDWGHVEQNAGLSYDLKGYGLQMVYQGPQGVTLKASWARRHGDNPNPTSTGMDQDGSRQLNRVWLLASFAF